MIPRLLEGQRALAGDLAGSAPTTDLSRSRLAGFTFSRRSSRPLPALLLASVCLLSCKARAPAAAQDGGSEAQPCELATLAVGDFLGDSERLQNAHGGPSWLRERVQSALAEPVAPTSGARSYLFRDWRVVGCAPDAQPEVRRVTVEYDVVGFSAPEARVDQAPDVWFHSDPGKMTVTYGVLLGPTRDSQPLILPNKDAPGFEAVLSGLNSYSGFVGDEEFARLHPSEAVAAIRGALRTPMPAPAASSTLTCQAAQLAVRSHLLRREERVASAPADFLFSDKTVARLVLPGRCRINADLQGATVDAIFVNLGKLEVQDGTFGKCAAFRSNAPSRSLRFSVRLGGPQGARTRPLVVEADQGERDIPILAISAQEILREQMDRTECKEYESSLARSLQAINSAIFSPDN